MELSAQGAAFVRRHEGFVSKTYLDPVGILTIGTGFTNRSATVRAHWRKTRGRDIRMGDTITQAESDALLVRCVTEEYGPPVLKGLGDTLSQHAYDAGCSVSFNCGPGALKWSWASLFKSGKRKAAADRLRVTAVTARGRKLAGLVRRRKEEADLLVDGIYSIHKSKSAVRHGADDSMDGYSAQLKQDQEMLRSLGYDCGKPDGLWGPKTKAAVSAFQRKHPDLVNDGILGPATRSKLTRLVNARSETAAVGLTGGGTAGTGTVTGDLSPALSDLAFYGGLTLLVLGLGYLVWFYRHEIREFIKR